MVTDHKLFTSPALPIRVFYPRPVIRRMTESWLAILAVPAATLIGFVLSAEGWFAIVLPVLLIAVLNVSCTVFFSALAGYGFAKFRFRGRRVLFYFVISTMMAGASERTVRRSSS